MRDDSRRKSVRRVLAYPKDRFREERPYYAMLADSLEAQGLKVEEFSPRNCLFRSYDILHLHHPEAFVSTSLRFQSFFRFAMFFLLVWLQKAKGCRVVWTAHNEGPHEPGHPVLERLYWKLFPSLVDAVIYLSQASQELVCDRWPVLRRHPAFIIPHGHFRAVYANRIGRDEARSRLGIGPGMHVLAFIGNIRRYKGVTELVRAFAASAEPGWHLVIAGKVVTPDLKPEIAAAASGDSRIQLIDHTIESDEMQLYLNAADLVVLPFKRILNSGSAILALSFNRPILVPDLGSLRELQTTVGENWIMLYTGDLTNETLRSGVDWLLRTERGPIAPLQGLDWTQIGRETMAVYSSCFAS